MTLSRNIKYGKNHFNVFKSNFLIAFFYSASTRSFERDKIAAEGNRNKEYSTTDYHANDYNTATHYYNSYTATSLIDRR